MSYAAKRGAGGDPLSPTGGSASYQPMHALLSQVQRHVDVVRPALAISITTEGESRRMVTRVSLLSAIHGQVSLEDLWSQKLCLAITVDLNEERDNGDVISSDRLGFMQRRTVSCPSAGVAQCGSADDCPKHSQPESELSTRPIVQCQPLNDFQEMFTLRNTRIFRIYFPPFPPSNPTQKTK